MAKIIIDEEIKEIRECPFSQKFGFPNCAIDMDTSCLIRNDAGKFYNCGYYYSFDFKSCKCLKVNNGLTK